MMKPSRGPSLILLLTGLLLLGQILPLWGQATAPSPALPTILEFDRKLCPICKKAEEIIQAVKDEHPGQFMVELVYIDEVPSLFRQFKVAFVPTQVFRDATGQEVFRHEGVFPREPLEQKLRELKFIL